MRQRRALRSGDYRPMAGAPVECGGGPGLDPGGDDRHAASGTLSIGV
jgi:hypothetical protein